MTGTPRGRERPPRDPTVPPDQLDRPDRRPSDPPDPPDSPGDENRNLRASEVVPPKPDDGGALGRGLGDGTGCCTRCGCTEGLIDWRGTPICQKCLARGVVWRTDRTKIAEFVVRKRQSDDLEGRRHADASATRVATHAARVESERAARAAESLSRHLERQRNG